MPKTISFATLLTALLVSTSAPAMAKGHSLAKAAEHKSASAPTREKKKHSQHASKLPLKSNGDAGAGRPPGDTGNSGGASAGKPPGDTNIGGAGAGKPLGDTGNAGGAGAGKPPGDPNTGGAGAGRPAGDTGNSGGAGAGRS